MPSIHDPVFRSSLEGRLRGLRPDSPRKWGKMSIDQMLWHLNVGLAIAVGERPMPTDWPRPPLPKFVMKFAVLNLPWPKGAPTAPWFLSTDVHEFEAQRARCLELVAKLATKPIDGPPTSHPLFGELTVNDVSRLQARHVDHHLKQFGQ
jgi:hypothetical protein